MGFPVVLNGGHASEQPLIAAQLFLRVWSLVNS
jgi:hypothetical protein